MVINIRNLQMEGEARIGMKVPVWTWGPSEHILRDCNNNRVLKLYGWYRKGQQ
jgi:hypothetical protein